MALPSDPVACTALELAAALRRREISARELLDAFAARAQAENVRLRAIVGFDLERARAAADASDARLGRGEPRGPFEGVPMSVKDTFDTAGMTTTSGLPWLSRNRPEKDAALVARLRAAGAVVFAKTSCPLASYDWQCVHPMGGRALNPWDSARTPGGSSGGSAAALAARLTPLELGSDVAGSIRVPAHFCGVFGLRPTEGALPTAGHAQAPGQPPSLRNLIACGPMARDPGDLRALFACLSAPSPGPLAPAGGAPGPASLRGLRVAWCAAWGGVRPDAATRDALGETARRLAEAGAVVEEAQPPDFPVDEAWRVWGVLQGHELLGAAPWPARVPGLGRGAVALGFALRFRPGLLAGVLARGALASRAAYRRALARRAELAAALDAFLSRHDVWITPVAATPAFSHRPTGAHIEVDGEPLPYEIANGSWSIPTAVGGHPIAVAPAAMSPGGLPIGLQWHARRGQDARLLAIVEAHHALSPWQPRWP
ncbi:amidase [Sorangium sp. So ce260]|uniref:amidase n=1 Tax=Sorangium sp. So ce260 TaxID=3133291 RepID=UPI003F5FDEE7